MSTKVFPVLGTDGYVTDPIKIADAIFGTSCLTKHSQTSLYYNNLLSLDWIVEQNAGDPDGMAKDIIEAYTKEYSSYFEAVTVTCEVTGPQTGTNQYILEIDIKFSLNGVPYNLGYAAERIDGIINQVMRAKNG